MEARGLLYRAALFVVSLLVLTTSQPAYASAQNIKMPLAARQMKDLRIVNIPDFWSQPDRQITRSDTALILCGLLGKTQTAERENIFNPFADVSFLANNAIGWLYKNGYVTGVTEVTFGADQKVNLHQFLTITIQALGYSKSEYNEETVVDFAVKKGIVSPYEVSVYANSLLTVRDAANITYSILCTNTANGTTCAEALANAGFIPISSIMKFPVSPAHPLGIIKTEVTPSQSAAINAAIDSIEGPVAQYKSALKIAMSKLILSNPVYSADETLTLLGKALVKIDTQTDKHVVIYIPSQKGMSVSPKITYSEMLWAFPHELTHGLSTVRKTSNALPLLCILNERIQDAEWSGRTMEGLTDLYAYLTMGGTLELIDRSSSGNIRSNYAVLSLPILPATDKTQVGYSIEQTTALMLCNALGRNITANAFYGTDEDYRTLMNYYYSLSNKRLDDLLILNERFVAYAYSFTGKKLDQKAANDAGKEYMTALLRICELRSKTADPYAFYAEMDALLKYSVQIHDGEFMSYYYETILRLRDAIRQ